MAEEAMVDSTQSLYQAVRDAVRALHEEHGPLYLALLLKFPERPPDEWTLLLGSRSLARDPYAGMHAVTKRLAALLSPEYAQSIRKVGIIAERDPFFLALASGLHVRPIGLVNIVQSSFGGIEIERGAAFAVMREVDGLIASAATIAE